MSDPQPLAGPLPAPMTFVDQFSASVIGPGVVLLSTVGHVPAPGGVAVVSGPSLAMSIPDALALVGLLQNLIAQAQAFAAQASQPN